jgi:hypothetical protein
LTLLLLFSDVLPSVDQWFTPLSEPVRKAPLTPPDAGLAWSTYTPVTVVVPSFGWFTGLAQPYPVPLGLPTPEQAAYSAPLSEAPETTTVDRWAAPLSLPTWSKTGGLNIGGVAAPTFTPTLPALDQWLQPLSLPTWSKTGELNTGGAYAPTFTPDLPGITQWHQPLSLPTWSKTGELNTGGAYAPTFTPTAASLDQWLTALSEPARRIPFTPGDTGEAPWSTYTPPSNTVPSFGWFEPLSIPARLIGIPAAEQPAHTAPLSEAPETTTVDRWHQPLSLPVWSKTGGLNTGGLSSWADFTPAAPSITEWGNPLSEPTRRVSFTPADTGLSWSAYTPSSVVTPSMAGWFEALSQPLFARLPAPAHPASVAPLSEAPETTSVDRWYQALSLPVWARTGGLNTGDAFRWADTTPAASSTQDWQQPLSTPVRGTPPAALGAVAWAGFTPDVPSLTRWFAPLSEPVRRGVYTPSEAGTTWSTYTPVAIVTPSFGWFAPLSLPAIPRPELLAGENPAFASPLSEAPETTTVDRWHADLSLPMWIKTGGLNTGGPALWSGYTPPPPIPSPYIPHMVWYDQTAWFKPEPLPVVPRFTPQSGVIPISNASWSGGLIHETAAASANLAGLRTLSEDQVVNFSLYVRHVLPLDGYVFWLGTGHAIPVRGSVHVSADRRQNEDETIAINRVVFTTGEHIQPFNRIAPDQMWIGEIAGVQFAFSHSGPKYRAAGLYHYNGDAVYPALSDLLVPVGMQPPATTLIVSNSLPIWLSLKSYDPIWLVPSNPCLTLFPSFAVPDNLRPPYGVVHIEPAATRALQLTPLLGPRAPVGSAALGIPEGTMLSSTHYQLSADRVRITIYGATNQQILDFVDTVNRFSYDYDYIGIMSASPVRDEKRTQAELGIIALKKTIEYEVSYYQTRANDVAQQLLLKAGIVISTQPPYPLIAPSLAFDDPNTSFYPPLWGF